MSEELDVFILRCSVHSSVDEVWVTCIHTERIYIARRVSGHTPVVGEAVCEDCRDQLERKQGSTESLRRACGGCVRERWPIAGAD